MNIKRKWAMPSKETFGIKPISELLDRYCKNDMLILDPFCNGKRRTQRSVTNDLDDKLEADYHLDALDFLKKWKDNEVDLVLFDPPYSPRQVSECYRRLNKTVNMQTTQSSYWSNIKKEISRIVRQDGFIITCGWNSGGIGKKNGFLIDEILLVPHGGWHNDTIVTVERKSYKADL